MPSRILTVLLGILLLAQSVAVAAATPVVADETPWWQGATCYEIFVRSFADSDGDGIGDLGGSPGVSTTSTTVSPARATISA